MTDDGPVQHRPITLLMLTGHFGPRTLNGSIHFGHKNVGPKCPAISVPGSKCLGTPNCPMLFKQYAILLHISEFRRTSRTICTLGLKTDMGLCRIVIPVAYKLLTSVRTVGLRRYHHHHHHHHLISKHMTIISK